MTLPTRSVYFDEATDHLQVLWLSNIPPSSFRHVICRPSAYSMNLPHSGGGLGFRSIGADGKSESGLPRIWHYFGNGKSDRVPCTLDWLRRASSFLIFLTEDYGAVPETSNFTKGQVIKIMDQRTLKTVLNYNQETGIFTWAKDRKNKIKKGDVAGSVGKRGYCTIMVFYKKYRAHRLAWLYMTGEFPQQQIDHINHNRSDNRWENLREVSHADNQKNKGMMKNNKSGVTGVSWHKHNKKWCAEIRINRKLITLGYFDKLDDAYKARLEASREYGFHENHEHIRSI